MDQSQGSAAHGEQRLSRSMIAPMYSFDRPCYPLSLEIIKAKFEDYKSEDSGLKSTVRYDREISFCATYSVENSLLNYIKVELAVISLASGQTQVLNARDRVYCEQVEIINFGLQRGDCIL